MQSITFYLFSKRIVQNLKVGSVIFINTNFQIQVCTTLP